MADVPPSSGEDEVSEIRRDTIERLERVVDIQVEIINGIDDKAERTARLVAILLGIILSAFSFASTSEYVNVNEVSIIAELSFLAGVSFLILSITFSIITYLSSKFRVGLRSGVGAGLSAKGVDMTLERHMRLTVGAYAHIVNTNKKVINANSKRFRYSLLSLLLAIVWLTHSGTVFIGNLHIEYRLSATALVVFLTVILTWYILTGKYLTLDNIP